jgi:hypothetical protein
MAGSGISLSCKVTSNKNLPSFFILQLLPTSLYDKSFPAFLIRHFETGKEKAAPFSQPGKTGFRFRNKGCAIDRILEQRKRAILFVSFGSVSVALS